MIGPEDFQETPKKNQTPVIVLAAAAVLLLIVGFISYRDYVHSRADQQRADSEKRIAELEAKIAKMGNPASVATQTKSTPVKPVPPPPDPEIEELRRQLAEMKRRTEDNTKKMERFETNSPPGVYTPPSAKSDTVPDYVKNSVNSPPGGLSPEAQRRYNDLQLKIRNAPAIGIVTSYNRDLDFVTIDAGELNGIKKSDRFSVRRGSDLLGVVRIEEVHADQSIALIVTKNTEFDGALKPRAGDEIISFDPF